MRHRSLHLMGFAATAALIFAGAATPAAAQSAVALKAPGLNGAPEAATLRQLPATHDELVFRGESATRSWPVYLNKTEAARITRFQMGLLNTVSVLPDRSTLSVSVNGIPLGEIPAASAQTPGIVSLPVPNGLLVPGFNAVTIGTALVHRVDCSVKATHELWALLKPNITGFVVPSQAASSTLPIQDLASERLAEDGTMRIHLRMSETASAAELSRAGRFIAALVARMHWTRPIVDIGPAAGTGPGLDIVIGRTADLQGKDLRAPSDTRVDGIAVGRDLVRNRTVLSVLTSDDASLDTAVATFIRASAEAKPAGAPAALRLLDQAAGQSVESGQHLSFADLGLGNITVRGRRFIATVRVSLPPDVYPGSFARANLYLDGGHAADLDASASMTIRVNGKIASFSSLGSGLPASFRRHRIDLPLNLFHAGTNEIEFEALTPSRLDESCDTAQMPMDPRLSLLGSSDLDFPSFAHLRVIPELAGSLDAGRLASTLYLPDATRASLGTGLTLEAMLAASAGPEGRNVDVAFHLAPPKADDTPGIVVAPLDQLPPELAEPLSRIATASADQSLDLGEATWGALRLGDAASSRKGIDSGAPVVAPAWSWSYARVSGAAWNWLQRWHFYLGGADSHPAMLPITNETLVVAAIEPRVATGRFAGIALPRISARPDQWLVITGDSATITHAGVERLAADRTLLMFAGQGVSLALDTGETHAISATDHTYVMPKSLALSEVRPILGGFMSDNIGIAALALLTLLAVLGGSSHVIIRRLGER